MIISKEADYAIRLLRCLSDGKRHVISEACDSEFIPRHFGYKIAEKLQAAGLISSAKGRGGGCWLSADLKEVTLFDLLATVESDCCLNHCLLPGQTCAWKDAHGGICHVQSSLTGLQRKFDEKLKGISLQEAIFG